MTYVRSWSVRVAMALVLVASTFALATTAQAATQGVTPTSIKIGSPWPLSGPFKVYSDFTAPGVRAALAYANERGGVNGRKIELVTADSGCTDAALGVQAGRKLVQQDKVFMLAATQCPTVVNSINKALLAGTKIFNLSITGAGRDFTKNANKPQKRGYFYSVNASTTSVMASAIAYAAKALKVKKFGVLAGTDSYGQDGINGVKAAVKRLKLPDAVITRIDPNSTDASVQVAQLKAAGVQAVLMPVFFNPALSAIRQMRSLNWNVPVFAAPAASTQQVAIAAQLNKASNVYGLAQARLLIGDPKIQAQIDKYAKYEKLTPSNVVGSFVGELAVEMLRRGGRKLTQDSFLKGVFSKPFKSAYYGTVDFKKTKGYAETVSCVTIYRWAGSDSAPIQQKVKFQCPGFRIPGLTPR